MLKGDDLARLNLLQTQCADQLHTAFAAHPGYEGVVQALILYDDGIFTAETALSSIRRVMSLGQPVMPDSKEFARLNKLHYQVQRPDTASESATGG